MEIFIVTRCHLREYGNQFLNDAVFLTEKQAEIYVKEELEKQGDDVEWEYNIECHEVKGEIK